MERQISASLGAMGSLLGKLDEILAAEHKDEILRLREDLEITRTLLLKLSKARDPPVTARYWMKDVRELSYDMEDCVDAETDWIGEKMSGFRTRVEDTNERYHRYMLEDSVPSCADIAIDYRLPTVDGQKAVVGLHAKGGQIDRLCQSLSDQDPELKVVSIVGVGGIGKTTLAEQLWHKLGAFQCRAFVQTSKKPDMRGVLRSILSQVCPHQPPGVSDVHNLTQDIYKHLQDKRKPLIEWGYTGKRDYTSLTEELVCNMLSRHFTFSFYLTNYVFIFVASYFVIIDDIWATSVWEVVSRAFPEGNNGSRIVTTTETEDVALACCAYQSRYIFNMEPLSVQHSKELFTSALFGSGEKELDECSHEIMRRCGGLPQAIVIIASILASNLETETRENTEKAGEQWNNLQNYVLNVLAADTPFEEILKQVLNLCYNSLPSCLQTCLLYLSVYPENYIIFKEDLTKQWIVEGFICASTKKETMDVAQRYFDKLFSMGLIQHIVVKNSDELSYAVHHMVHDFITFKSMEENFVTAMDYSQSTIQLSDKVRRLSLQFGSAAYATTPASTRLSQVRSLTFIGLVKCMPSISEFKLLRVLILNFWGDQGSTSFDLARISELFLLRYLQIICNVIVQLPDQMQGLEHLETLEINARPDWSLLHLCLGGGTNLPSLYPSSSSMSISSRKPCYPFDPVKTFELLPPICSIPKWIGQLNNLCTLKIVVRELLRDNISNLGGLPALTVLSLYVRRHTAEIIVFNTAQFVALEYFEFKCGVLSLAFLEGAMLNLQMLKIGFNAHKGDQYGHFLAGIEHLSNLKEVVGIIGVAGGAEEPDWRAAESAFRDAVPNYPKLDSEVNVKRANWIEEEYGYPENQLLIQEKHPPSEQPGNIKEESDEDIDQHLIQEKHPPSEQPGKIKEESDKDIKQHQCGAHANLPSPSPSPLPALSPGPPQPEVERMLTRGGSWRSSHASSTSSSASLRGMGEERTISEEDDDGGDKLYVAVGKDLKDGRSNLLWAARNVLASDLKLVLLHVHQPADRIMIGLCKVSASLLEENKVKAYRKIERDGMCTLLNQYINFCRVSLRVQAETLVIEKNSPANGIVELIDQHHITKLVMGTSSVSGRRKAPKSRIAAIVHLQAKLYCQIFYICKEALACYREATQISVKAELPRSSFASSISDEPEFPPRSLSLPPEHPCFLGSTDNQALQGRSKSSNSLSRFTADSV